MSVDARGSPATAVASVCCLRRRGRHVQVGLLLGSASTPPIPMDLVIARELEIYGSHGMAHEYPPMLALVAKAPHRPDLLLGKVIGLEEAGTALAAMDRPSAGITVIELPHESGTPPPPIFICMPRHSPGEQRTSAASERRGCARPEDGRSFSLLEPASREVSCQSED